MEYTIILIVLSIINSLLIYRVGNVIANPQRLSKKTAEYFNKAFDKDLSLIDLQEKVLDTCLDMKQNPEAWEIKNHTVKNINTGAEIWTANTIDSRQFYDDKDVKLTVLEKQILDQACKSLIKWHKEIAISIAKEYNDL